jgi:hypothetical protein
MALTRIHNLNRLQRQRLRNPLPPDSNPIEVTPTQMENAKKTILGFLHQFPDSARARRTYREFANTSLVGKRSPYFLAMQGVPAARSHSAVQMPAEEVAIKLLGLDLGDPVRRAFPTWDNTAEIVDAVEKLTIDIQQRRDAANQAVSDQAEQVRAQVEAEATAQAARLQATASKISQERREVLEGLLQASRNALAKALREDTFTDAELNYLSQRLGKPGTQAHTKRWREGTLRNVRSAIERARDRAEPEAPREQRERPERPAEEVERPRPVAERLSLLFTGGDGGDEPPDDPPDEPLGDPPDDEEDDEEVDEDEEAFLSRIMGGGSFPEDDDDDYEEEDEEEDAPFRARDPQKGRGSAEWDPDKIGVTKLALTKKIRASTQRSEARKARLKDLDTYLLSYRRPQARDRSRNLNAPVLYSPPEDVMRKIEEIMEAESYAKGRAEMPQQFQDVLVYVLTKDHVVGRSRIIPAGSVEVYNKGTLVGTFGKGTYIQNIKSALQYAGTLVGADLAEGVFKQHKGSRMRSRILMARQGSDGFRLIAPSLSEVLRKTPVEIEITLDQMYNEGTKGFGERRASNPRRAPVRSFGRTRYIPTVNGYRVLNGRNSGRHYTVNDFGHACKLALILDHM